MGETGSLAPPPPPPARFLTHAKSCPPTRPQDLIVGRAYTYRPAMEDRQWGTDAATWGEKP